MSSDRHRHMLVADLACYGCAHSAASEPFPSGPSGERPCQFCIRNPWRHLRDDNFVPTWYNGSAPLSDPMDAYVTLDMIEQYAGWLHDAEFAGEEVLNRLIDLKGRLQKPVD